MPVSENSGLSPYRARGAGLPTDSDREEGHPALQLCLPVQTLELLNWDHQPPNPAPPTRGPAEQQGTGTLVMSEERLRG